jgi:hypothetical protein
MEAPSRAKLRIENAEPRSTLSITDKVDDKRLKPRIDKQLPKLKQPSTDKEAPILHIPSVATDEAKQQKSLSEREAPI